MSAVHWKIKGIVDNLLLQYHGGEKFFDALDNEMRKGSNRDLIQALLDQITADWGPMAIIVSGNFGQFLIQAKQRGYLRTQSEFYDVSGSLRGKKTDLLTRQRSDQSVILKAHDFYHRQFVFLDDSYYSGSTKEAIEKFLHACGSTLMWTYVVYSGSDRPTPKMTALYRFYDYYQGRVKQPTQLLKILEELASEIKFDASSVQTQIAKGQITTVRGMFAALGELAQKYGVPFNRELQYKYTHKKLLTYERLCTRFLDFINS